MQGSWFDQLETLSQHLPGGIRMSPWQSVPVWHLKLGHREYDGLQITWPGHSVFCLSKLAETNWKLVLMQPEFHMHFLSHYMYTTFFLQFIHNWFNSPNAVRLWLLILKFLKKGFSFVPSLLTHPREAVMKHRNSVGCRMCYSPEAAENQWISTVQSFNNFTPTGYYIYHLL